MNDAAALDHALAVLYDDGWGSAITTTPQSQDQQRGDDAVTSYEYAKGYREQSAWLRRQAPSIPSAEHTLISRQGTTDGSVYNQGGDQATADYIEALRQILADMTAANHS